MKNIWIYCLSLVLTSVGWRGKTRGWHVTQKFLIRLVWENGYTQVVNSPTREDALLDVYLVGSESAFTSCSNVQGISDHCEVLSEVKWEENCRQHQVERVVSLYHKTNVSGLQSFLRGKFASWASSSSWVQKIWKRFKELVFESIDRFVPHKILRKILMLNTTRKWNGLKQKSKEYTTTEN